MASPGRQKPRIEPDTGRTRAGGLRDRTPARPILPQSQLCRMWHGSPHAVRSGSIASCAECASSHAMGSSLVLLMSELEKQGFPPKVDFVKKYMIFFLIFKIKNHIFLSKSVIFYFENFKKNMKYEI